MKTKTTIRLSDDVASIASDLVGNFCDAARVRLAWLLAIGDGSGYPVRWVEFAEAAAAHEKTFRGDRRGHDADSAVLFRDGSVLHAHNAGEEVYASASDLFDSCDEKMLRESAAQPDRDATTRLLVSAGLVETEAGE